MAASSSMPSSLQVPAEIVRKWQEIVDLVAAIMNVPSAMVMRAEAPNIKVFVSNRSEYSQFEPGCIDTGPYCRTVINARQPLLVPDALEHEQWRSNPLTELGLISYLGVPISWPDGQIFGTICVRDNKRNEHSELYLKLLLHFRDVLQADLKSLTRLEGELEEREIKIRRLFDANIIGIFIWDLGGQVSEANDAFLQMVGYDREDVLSGRIRVPNLTPPEWDEVTARALDELKRTGTFHPYEKEYHRRDGSRVPVLLGGAAFGREPAQAIAFVIDLTERKRAEILTAQVFETAPDGICIVERDYRYRRANPVYCRRWGVAAQGIVGMSVSEVIGFDNFERILKPKLDRCFAGEEVKFEWISESRGRLYLSVTYSPLRSGSGEVEAALVIQRDLTQYMRASEALRAAQAELAHANRVATMGQLTASIAHEVNQPIAATLTNAQAALRWLTRPAPDLGEVREALASIVKDAVRAGDVVSRIRDLMKKTPPRKDLLDVNRVVREVLNSRMEKP
jgi:PAS domain S-box-containing protein